MTAPTQTGPAATVVQSLNALTAPVVTARLLAGFLDPVTVIEGLASLPPQPDQVLARIEQQFGSALALPRYEGAGKPVFEEVTEDPVLNLLREVVPELPEANLSNLQSFEWVQIDPIIAGHLRTEQDLLPMYHPDPTDLMAVARFALYPFKTTYNIEQSTDGGYVLRTPGPCAFAPPQMQLTPIGLLAIFRLVWRPAPIRVLVVDGKAIALSGLGRLATLRALGIERALCAVSYGYGSDVVDILQTTPSNLIDADRPPLVSDFLNPMVSTEVLLRPRSFAYDVRISETACS